MTTDYKNQTMNAGHSEFVPFLQLVADDLFREYGNDLSQVTIIVPNKRANLFFNQYLAKHITDKPLWTPQFTTIGDLFSELCPLNIADPIQQICKLYQAYKNVSNTDETLDKFYSWAELMKNDFEDIDNNLADAEKLFKNIENLEELKDYSFLSDNQRKTLEHYFDSFNIGSGSLLKKRFLGVWQYMFPTYTEYRRLLTEEGLCYSGMMKRYVVEGIKENEIDIDAHLNNGVYVVIGFNVLNETEKKLFQYIARQRTTLFYWDYDEKYLHTEAGRFVASNIKMFGNRFAEHPEYYRHFGTQQSVKFIKAPTENAQTRYVSQWIDEKVTEHPLQESVVVLCNENVLQPVLHSIPSNASGKNLEMNVTMGYPLQYTPIYSYVIALMELQMRGAKGGDQWKYKEASVILKHPYTKRIIGDKAIEVLSILKEKNTMFPRTEQILEYVKDDENAVSYLKSIFTTVSGHLALIEYLINIVKVIGKSYKEELQNFKSRVRRKENIEKGDFELQLYFESVFATHSVLSRVHTLQEREAIFNVNNSTLSRLLVQMLKQKSIPFHGEPAIGLQVMGLLETRNLDFRNVIMLSVNEGQLPKSERMASLIPYSLRDAYGMTTIEKQVSLYAFYFYNLLQRAENVTVMYNSATDGMSTGEMSRFMMQLQVESKKIFGRNDAIELFSLTAPNEAQIVNNVIVERNDEVKKILGSRLKISPTAINSYIDCPLKYYMQRVAGFQEDNDVSEEVDNAMFGTIFHKSMELIYKPLLNKQLLPTDINALLSKKKYIEDIVDTAFATEYFKLNSKTNKELHYNGEQLLNRHVIIDYVRNQLIFDAKSCPMTVLGLEEKMNGVIVLDDEDKTEIEIGGTIDRYERLHTATGDVLRITDYKTNAKAQKATDLPSIFDSETNNRPYNYLQALYYCEVVAQYLHPDCPISPALMYIKTALDSRECRLSIAKEFVEDYVSQYRSEYVELLKKKLLEIFRSNVPFTQHEHYCESCEFRNYCKK